MSAPIPFPHPPVEERLARLRSLITSGHTEEQATASAAILAEETGRAVLTCPQDPTGAE
ncbi:hypothetical protein ACWD00_31590 [Streptomyces viridiviolaceus]